MQEHVLRKEVGTVPVTETAFEALRNRVVIIEQRIAVREETLKTIADRLDKIEIILSRLTWLLITSILSAAMAFILSGGLTHVLGH